MKEPKTLLWWQKSFEPRLISKTVKTCATCGGPAGLRCSRCSAVGYCSQDCQRKDWREHKTQCPKLKILAEVERKRQAAKDTLANGSEASAAPAPAPAAPSAAVSNSTPPIAAVELFPYAEFVKNWKSLQLHGLRPIGMENAGTNTCYINALLQALFAVRPFVAHLLSDNHTPHQCPRPNSSVWCPLCVLRDLASSNTTTKSTSDCQPFRNIHSFIRNIRKINADLHIGEQHDAQEFYVSLLDVLEQVSLREAEARALEAGKAMPKDRFSLETTGIHHAFTIYMRNEVQCNICNHLSKSYEANTLLMLNLPDQSTTLEDLLAVMTTPERLEGESAYSCDGCHRKVTASKVNLLEVAPNALSIQLNRATSSFGTEMKRLTAVEFPAVLDLAERRAHDSIDAAPVVYDLCSVVAHEGSTVHDGHYYSFVRYGDLWYSCDDNYVEIVPVEHVLKQQTEAYMLFYERRDHRVPQLSGGGGSAAVVQENGEAVMVAVGVREAEEPSMEEAVVAKVLAQLAGSSNEVQPAKKAAAVVGEEGKEQEEVQMNGFIGGGHSEDAVSSSASGGDSSAINVDKNAATPAASVAAAPATPGAIEKPSAASAGLSCDFKQIKMPDGSRILNFSVNLPEGEEEQGEPVMKMKTANHIWAVLKSGKKQLLKVPVPVPVSLPARETNWNKENRQFTALFNVK